MIKMKVSPYDLRRLHEEKPALYAELVDAIPGLPKGDELRERYDEWSAFIQDPSLLPQELLDIARWEAIKPLKVLFDRDRFAGAKGIKEALASSQVHLPGNELLGISCVEVREDYCTEDLQRDLDRGWRIVAVCVRSSQRRPDYVLGRFTRF